MSIGYNETSCSRDAYARGSHQRVIAMVFYGVHDMKSKAKQAGIITFEFGGVFLKTF